MSIILLDAFAEFAKGLSFSFPAEQAANVAMAMNPSVLIAGIILIIVSIIIFFVLKKMIEHAILGAISWAIAIFVFNIQLPLIPSLVISIVMGPAGLGAMLLMKFMGLF